MQRINIIDTFADFLALWEKVQNAAIPDQIECWKMEYMAQWPELLDKQINDYASQGVNWHQVASERIFPYIGSRLRVMQEARRNILSDWSIICKQAYEKLGFETDLVGLIYVGIGCGAGWVTTYKNKPAILFGLENIAECGWHNLNSIEGLIAHELGHVIQDESRRQTGVTNEEGAWWQLFTEGFAQRCEHLILEKETWHEAESTKQDWVTWCQNNRAYLASEFLRCTAVGGDVRSFFGSWFNINGYSLCGYYLGHEAIKELEFSGMSIREIGTLEEPEVFLREIMNSFANDLAKRE